MTVEICLHIRRILGSLLNNAIPAIFSSFTVRLCLHLSGGHPILEIRVIFVARNLDNQLECTALL